MQKMFEKLASGQLRQQDGDGRDLRNHEQQDDVARPKEEDLHLLDVLLIARAEIGKGLEVCAPQKLVGLRSFDPTLLELARIVRHEATISLLSPATRTEELRKKREQRRERDDRADEHEGIEERLERVDLFAIEQDLRAPS